MHRYTSILLALFLFVFGPLLSAQTLDINTATAEQFETLAGIGKAKAKAIVEDRAKNGNFESIDDLARVKGIGAATIEKNRSNMTVGTGVPTTEKTPQDAAAPDSTAEPMSPDKAK